MGNSISVFRITISKYTAIGKHIIIVVSMLLPMHRAVRAIICEGGND